MNLKQLKKQSHSYGFITPSEKRTNFSTSGFTAQSEEHRTRPRVWFPSDSVAKPSPRGFTLLIAVVLTSVLLSVGLALLDIALKQVTLSSIARQSQYAFYAADSAMECALFWDQQRNVFRYDFPGSMGDSSLDVKCGGLNVTNYTVSQSGGTRVTRYSVPCAAGGIQAEVEVYKTQTGVTNMYANGYNTCNVSDPRRIERGLKVFY